MKTGVKRIVGFYLFGNFHIALCAAALTHLSGRLFHLQTQWPLIFLSFCGTLSFYSFQRFVGIVRREDYQARDDRHKWNFQHKNTLAVLSFLPLIPAAWIFFQLHTDAKLILVATVLLSGIYASPLFRVNGKWFRLRDFPAIKIFFVAMVWLAVTVLLPLANVYEFYGWNTVPGTMLAACGWSLIMFLVIFSLTIPFDVRDLKTDPASIRSLPMLLGEKKAVRLAQAGILISVILFYVLSENTIFYFSFANFLAYAIWSALTIWILNDCSSKKEEFYFSFTIDGLLILLWLFLTGKDFIQ